MLTISAVPQLDGAHQRTSPSNERRRTTKITPLTPPARIGGIRLSSPLGIHCDGCGEQIVMTPTDRAGNVLWPLLHPETLYYVHWKCDTAFRRTIESEDDFIAWMPLDLFMEFLVTNSGYKRSQDAIEKKVASLERAGVVDDWREPTLKTNADK